MRASQSCPGSGGYRACLNSLASSTPCPPLKAGTRRMTYRLRFPQPLKRRVKCFTLVNMAISTCATRWGCQATPSHVMMMAPDMPNSRLRYICDPMHPTHIWPERTQLEKIATFRTQGPQHEPSSSSDMGRRRAGKGARGDDGARWHAGLGAAGGETPRRRLG